MEGGYVMATTETIPHHVLTLELKIEPFQVHIVDKHMEIGRRLYNAILGELLKRYEQMKRTKKHQKLKRQTRAVTRLLSQYEQAKSKEGKKKFLFYTKERSSILKQIFAMQREYGLSEYDTHDWVKSGREHFSYQPLKKNGKRSESRPRLHSAIAQTIATRAWKAFEKLLKGEAKQVHFKRYGELFSLEGKQSHTGIVFDKNTLSCAFAGLTIPVFLKKDDVYAQEALGNRLKYARIKIQTIRGKERYYVQLILEGVAPPKRDKHTGKFKHILGKGRVGTDIGTRSVAVVGRKNVVLQELAPTIQNLSREIRRIQRQMDRSRRSTNPQNYNANGTVKKGRKTWAYSKRYLKLRAKLKELRRKEADNRKQEHRNLINQLVFFGDTFYVETMRFQALQKKAKKTEKSEKTGKFKRKKRFGKSIGQKAPALFVRLFEEKVTRLGGSFYKVNTQTFKASQYDHVNQNNVKKALSKRWHVFEDGTRIQRDLYSAYLLSNSNEELTQTRQDICEEHFDSFRKMHNETIGYLRLNKILVANAGL